MTGWSEDELNPIWREITEGEKRKEQLSSTGSHWSKGEEILLVALRQLFDALREVVAIRRHSGLSFEDHALPTSALALTAKIRLERLRRLNDEIEAFEKRAMGFAMTGQWTTEYDAQLSALYDERRRLYDGKGTDDE
jgi:hypothetical protein